jgi:hypothetical protein
MDPRTSEHTYPKAGATKQAVAQAEMPKGKYSSLKTSDSDAPPVARIGEPRKPCKNRRNMKAGALRMRARGMLTSVYRKNVVAYGMLRPIWGISLNGEKSKGPMPYPSLMLE